MPEARAIALQAAIAFLAVQAAPALAAPTCTGLVGATAAGSTRVLHTELVTAGPTTPWRPPMGFRQPAAVTTEFCRVTAAARPARGSDIRFELWLPARWNQSEAGRSAEHVLFNKPFVDAMLVASIKSVREGCGV